MRNRTVNRNVALAESIRWLPPVSHRAAAVSVVERLGLIDALANVRSQGNVTPLLPLIPELFRQGRNTLTACGLHNLAGNDDAGLAHTLNARIDESLGKLIRI
ncbi:hypothetical protein HC256_007548 [Beauveria bassiana]|nr:hypothetical protein HC256_007548 [Beauveria bassiana]